MTRGASEPHSLGRVTAWLTLLGAVCLFGSWIAENYLQRAAEADAQRLERIFTTVVSEEHQRTQWLIEYNRAVSEHPQNPERVGLAAANLSKSLLQLLEGGHASIARSFPGYKGSLERKQRQFAEVDRLLQERDFEGLVAALNALMARYESEIEPIAGQQAVEWLDAFGRSIRWSDMFLKLYLCGSALLGVAYLLRNRAILFGSQGQGEPPQAGPGTSRRGSASQRVKNAQT